MSSRDAPSPHLRSVGTDVVDLDQPRCAGKASDTRFLDRVLTDGERRVIERALGKGGTTPIGDVVTPADLLLWRIWALKEAAFKAVTGLLGTPPVFEHRAFAVRFGRAPEPEAGRRPSGRDDASLDAVVRWRDRHVLGRIVDTGTGGPVQAVACVEGDGRAEVSADTATGAGMRWSPARLRWGRAELADEATVPSDRLTERERRSVHSPASARVRLHARRDLAGWAEVADHELEIVCDEGPPGRMPPRVLLRGEPAPWSVGLSHHGRWLAWVLGRTGS